MAISVASIICYFIKITQEQLYEKVNISVKRLSCIEVGLNFVFADLLKRLVEKYLANVVKEIKTEIR